MPNKFSGGENADDLMKRCFYQFLETEEGKQSMSRELISDIIGCATFRSLRKSERDSIGMWKIQAVSSAQFWLGIIIFSTSVYSLLS